MEFLEAILNSIVNDAKKKEMKFPIDQKCTHHIITYKTNTVYIDRTKADLPFIVDQIEKMLPQEGIDVVYFNA